MPRRKKKRQGFYFHLSDDSEVDKALDQWIDYAHRRGINVSGFVKTLWYERVTGKSAATGEPLVVPQFVAPAESQERGPAPTEDPIALRLLGMED